MENENPEMSLIVFSFTRCILENFEKCIENENYQIFKFTIFSAQKHDTYVSTKNSKYYSLYCTSLLVYTTEVTAKIIQTLIMRYFFEEYI